MSQGDLTARMANILIQKLASHGLMIFCSHRGEFKNPEFEVGQTKSWLEGVELGYPDIAVVSRNLDKAVALIEIEQSPADPKKLLGDVFATLLGDEITFEHSQRIHQ